MKLGAFSLSLKVNDLKTSLHFYEKLGFKIIGGNPDDLWVILKNEDSVIGLFEGMFEHNMMTFNPGFDSSGNAIKDFTDIREINQELKKQGIFSMETIQGEKGPGYMMIEDPDGNLILIDQHV